MSKYAIYTLDQLQDELDVLDPVLHREQIGEIKVEIERKLALQPPSTSLRSNGAGVLCGLLLCFVTWGIFLVSWAASGIFGKHSVIEIVIYFSPMVGTLGPWIIGTLEERANVKALFLVAFCPVLAVLNFFIVGFAEFKFGYPTLVTFAIGSLWLTPLLVRLTKSK